MARGLLVSVVLCACFVALCQATNYTWQNTAGGAWSTAANWDPVGVPGASDFAIFDYSPCYGIGSNNAPDCVVDIGSTPLTIAGLIMSQSGGKYALSGTLTVSSYTYLNTFAFYNLALTTQGLTEYDDNDIVTKMVGTTWTLQGNTIVDTMDWTVITSQIINQGTLNVTTALWYDTGDKYDNGVDFTKSLFTNAGTMNVNTYMQYDDSESRFTGSFTNTGTFNNVGGHIVFISSTSKVYRAKTSWSGTVTSTADSETQFYMGVHNFSSGLNFAGFKGELNLLGSYDAWDSGICGDMSFDIAVTLPLLTMDMCFTINFNKPTYIKEFNFLGGNLAGASNSIVIGNLTGGGRSGGSAQFRPLFNSKLITIIDGHDISGVLTIHDDALVQINGTMACTIHMDWYGHYISATNSFSVGGILQVNPGGTLRLHASDSIYVYAHYFHIRVYIYGKVEATKAQDVDARSSQTQIGNFVGGGILAGACTAIRGAVDDQSNYGFGDLTFTGDWTIEPGASFSGAGIYYFSGPEGDDIVFNIPYTFNVIVTLGYKATFHFNYNVTFTTLWWSGGSIFSANNAVITLVKGSENVFYSNGYQNTLDGITILNNGNIVYYGYQGSMTTLNSVLINNGNYTTGEQNFDDDFDQLTIYNNGYFILPAGGRIDVEHVKLYNNGTIYSRPGTSVGDANNNFGYKATDLYLSSTGTYTLNVYGRSSSYGNMNNPFDIHYFTSAESCRFGGTLMVNFVILPKQAGSNQFVPVVGDIYPMFGLQKDMATGKGNCVCQFDNIVTNLDKSKYSIGITYDNNDSTYTSSSIINIIVCSPNNATCATNTRVGASCPAMTTTGAATTSKGSSTGGATSGAGSSTQGSSTGSPATTGNDSTTDHIDSSAASVVVASLSLLFMFVFALL